MRNRSLMFIGLSLGAAGLVVVAQETKDRQGPTDRTQPACRIGTFNRADLLLAYYRSSIHEESLRGLMKRREKAETAGDKSEVARIEAEGAAMQENAHRQLAGEAPIQNVLEHLKPAMEEIAKEAGVLVIVEKPLYRDVAVMEVDVTPMMAKRFEPAKKKESEPKTPND